MKYPEVAKRFSYILNLRNMSQQELAEKTEIGKSSISHYLNGNHCPTNDRAFLLAKVLEVNPAWLMGFDAPMNEANNEDDENDESREKEFTMLYSQLSPAQKTLVDNLLKTFLSKQ